MRTYRKRSPKYDGRLFISVPYDTDEVEVFLNAEDVLHIVYEPKYRVVRVFKKDGSQILCTNRVGSWGRKLAKFLEVPFGNASRDKELKWVLIS